MFLILHFLPSEADPEGVPEWLPSLRTHIPEAVVRTCVRGKDERLETMEVWPDAIVLDPPTEEGDTAAWMEYFRSSYPRIPVFVLLPRPEGIPAHFFLEQGVSGIIDPRRPASWEQLLHAVPDPAGEVRSGDLDKGLDAIPELESDRRRLQALELAFRGSMLAIWDWDLAQSSAAMESLGQELLGFLPGDSPSTYQEWAALVHPVDLPKASSAIVQLLSGQAARLEAFYRIRNHKGQWRWIQTSGMVAARDAQGKVLRVTGTHRDITKRITVEETLRHSEGRYRSLVELSPDGIVVCRQGIILYANASFRKLVRLPPDHPLIGKPFFDFLEKQERAELLRGYDHIERQGGSSPPSQQYLLATDGSRAEVELRGVGIAYARTRACQILVRDLTAFRQLQVALRNGEENFRLALEASELGLFCWELETGHIQINEVLARILGYEKETLLGILAEEFRGIFPTQDWVEILDLGRSLLKGEAQSFDREHKLRRADGVWRWFHARGKRIVPGDGQSPRILGTIEEIEGRKKMEQELRGALEELGKRETELRQVTEYVSDIIFRHDASGYNHYVSPASFSVLGYHPGELKGQALLDLLEKPSRELWMTTLGKLRNGQTEAEVQLQVHHRDGYKLCLEINTRSIQKDTAIDPPNFISVARDITKRRQIEELQSQSARLEAVGRLAGGVAHDFNNLLAVVKGFAELLLQEETPSELSREYLERISKAADQGSSLTKRLLAFSRRQPIAPTTLDLNNVIRELQPLLTRLVGEEFQLHLSMARNLHKIRSDPSQIEQVLMNLVINAREAMPKGGTISIVTENRILERAVVGSTGTIPSGHYVVLCIADHGMGMDSETQRRMFDPFFTTKADFGNGLGLSIVYGIVEQNHGHIAVESSLQQGTAFHLFFPPAEESTAAPLPPPPVETSIGSTGGTVLVVEDNPDVRHFLRTFCQASGYQCLEAQNGRAALELLENSKEPVEIVISDVVMPEMGGVEFARRLYEIRPKLQVVLISGYADQIHSANSTPNIIAFLQKPIHARELQQILAKASSYPSQP